MVTAGTKVLEGMPHSAPTSHIRQNGVPSLRASICQYIKGMGSVSGIPGSHRPLALITIIGPDDDPCTPHFTN